MTGGAHLGYACVARRFSRNESGGNRLHTLVAFRKNWSYVDCNDAQRS